MSATEVQDPLEELQRENETAENLLLRILEEAEYLKAGTDVPPGRVAEELRLLDQYLEVHRQRLDQILQPEARVVAMPGCFPHLDKILQDHEEVKGRMRDAREALEAFEQGSEGARARLAEVLELLATKDHEVAVYEGDYPLSCLMAALPEEAARRVAEKFGTSQPNLADLDEHIRRVLAAPSGDSGSPLRVHCAQEGCSAMADARVVPARGGRLGLMAPEGGWGLIAQKAELKATGATRIRVDFRCPSHAGGA